MPAPPIPFKIRRNIYKSLDKHNATIFFFSAYHVKLPAHRADLPGKETVCFLLRPLSPPARRGLWVALLVKIKIIWRSLSKSRVANFAAPRKTTDITSSGPV